MPMLSNAPTELAGTEQTEGLLERVLSGEVFVVRDLLQGLDLYRAMVEASLIGIRNSAGSEAVELAKSKGFDRVHEWVESSDVPAMTEAVYQEMTPRSRFFLDKIVPHLFSDDQSYYFERDPNVRFHVPYDLTVSSKKNYEKFALSHGQGKITAHGPHRDSWVDCPDNAVNIWIAVGPVQRGNGLSIYAKDYEKPVSFRDGYIQPGEVLRQPMNFDLGPGDAILFHGDHLHASEINQTASTRYVVSYRLTVGKPNFPNGHYHHYLHAGWSAGPLRRFAEIPASLQPSYVATRIRWVRDRLFGRPSAENYTRPKANGSGGSAADSDQDEMTIKLSDLPIGAIRPLSKSVCVARLSEDQVVAVSRRCTHQGADLSGGWVEGGKLVCPWHNLHFDVETGAPPCESLRPLRRFACEVRDDRVLVRAESTATASSDSKVEA